MKNRISILIGILFLIISANMLAQDDNQSKTKVKMGEVIVTATKIEGNQSETGSSTTVITEEEIEKSGKGNVLDLLQDVPGISIMQTGSFGGGASLYIRGSKPGHTLVMIDGVEVNDPMVSDRSFDFAHMLTDNIERIEIVRGAQSTLYGSDAMGGVINIITKKGEGKLKPELTFEAGSYKTFKEALGISGSTEKISYSFNVSRMDSDGTSKAKDGAEDDGYENTTFSSRLGFMPSDNIDIDFVFRWVDAAYDYDDGENQDDPNKEGWWENKSARLSLEHAVNDVWDYKISVTYAETDREYKDSVDSVDDGPYENSHNWFNGDSKKAEWQNNFNFVDCSTTTIGVEYEEESGSANGINSWDVFASQEVNNIGYYLQNQFEFNDVLFITPGVRLDDNERFGNKATYKISGSYLVKSTGTRFKANWGTGFKAPSLYQLYSPYGDLNLEPDEGETFDVGFEQTLLSEKMMMGAVYFHNEFENMVDFDMNTWTYTNVDNAEMKGVEFIWSYEPVDTLSFGANYTYTSTEDKDTGLELARRPKTQANLNMNWGYNENGNVNVSVAYIGNRWNDTANTLKMNSFTTVNLSSYYDINKYIKLFGRIENLFDKEIQQVHGYAATGISFYGGFKLSY